MKAHTKKCSKCGKVKKLDLFYKSLNGKYGRNHYCIPCHKEYSAQLYKSNEAFRKKRRAYQLEHKYGMTEKIFDEMMVNQNDCCAICKKKFIKRRSVFIDHDHNNNKVRGLLCPSCNTMIGLAKENLDVLDEARDYLIKFKLY